MAGRNFLQRGGKRRPASGGRQCQTRLTTIQTPDSGGSEGVAVHKPGDKGFQNLLGFGRRAEISTQVVNFFDQVHE